MSMSDQFGRQFTNITNMSAMMARFGVDPRVLASNLLGSTMHVCLDCPSGEVCHDWLAQAATLPRQAPTFCPNVPVFEQAQDCQLRGSPLVRPALNPNVMPNVHAWDVSRQDCEGSLKDVGWEGRMGDPGQPKEIRCPACGAKMELRWMNHMTQHVVRVLEQKFACVSYWATMCFQSVMLTNFIIVLKRYKA